MFLAPAWIYAMATNLERFRKDLEALIAEGKRLDLAMRYDLFPKDVGEAIKKQYGEKADEYIEGLPSFRKKYQRWYTEALAVMRQLLPDRVTNFVGHYEPPKARKEFSNENYRIHDYLQGLSASRGAEQVVVPGAAMSHFQQQLAILEAAKARFESSLFEIRQLVQADLLDSEIATAEELAGHKFLRPAGVVAGVVLECHLRQICQDHKITVAKKNPTIADLGELLKGAGVIGVPQWRFIQHLADIRNLCGHGRNQEPTPEQLSDLIAGVKKVMKTVF